MTIEERALHLAEEFSASKANKVSAIYRACIRMAQEQQDICLDAFRNWLADNPQITYQEENRDIIKKLYDKLLEMRPE